MGLIFGTAFGLIFGSAIDNLAIGIAIGPGTGIAFGIMIGMVMESKYNKDPIPVDPVIARRKKRMTYLLFVFGAVIFLLTLLVLFKFIF